MFASLPSVNPFLFIIGLSCPSCIQASLSLNGLKLATYTWISSQLAYILWRQCLFKKILGLVLASEIRPKSAFSAFRALLPLQTILLVGCESPLQIAIAFWRTIIVSRKFQFNRKGRPNCHFYLQRAVTPRLDGQHYPLITYQGVSFKGGETL